MINLCTLSCYLRYNINSAWFLDIKISTCLLYGNNQNPFVYSPSSSSFKYHLCTPTYATHLYNLSAPSFYLCIYNCLNNCKVKVTAYTALSSSYYLGFYDALSILNTAATKNCRNFFNQSFGIYVKQLVINSLEGTHTDALRHTHL